MPEELDNVRAALAALSPTELAAVCATASAGDSASKALRLYLAHACEWERARRARQDCALSDPLAAIDLQERNAAFFGLAELLNAFQDNRAATSLLFAVAEACKIGPPAQSRAL